MLIVVVQLWVAQVLLIRLSEGALVGLMSQKNLDLSSPVAPGHQAPVMKASRRRNERQEKSDRKKAIEWEVEKEFACS